MSAQRRDASPRRSTRLTAQRAAQRKQRLEELCRALPKELRTDSSRRAMVHVLDECQAVLQGADLGDFEVQRLLDKFDQTVERLQSTMPNALQFSLVRGDARARKSMARMLTPLCRGCFGYDWLSRSFVGDLLFVAKLDDEIVGFLTAADKGEGGVEINFLCAKSGAGGPLLDWLIALARSEGVRRIHLFALPENVNFYRKKGFQLSDDCQESPEAKAALDSMINRKGDCSQPDEEWKDFVDKWDETGDYEMTLCL